MLLGVRGKLALWQALEVIQPGEPGLASVDLAILSQRAESQLSELELHRRAVVRGHWRRSTVTTYDEAGQRAPGEGGLMLAATSNAVVRIHKRFYGKGPNKARAHLSENVLIVVLEGGLMRSEQTLRERGRTEAVVHARLAMQRSIEPQMRAAIASELRRPGRSLINAVDPHNELEVVVCVFAPDGAEGSSLDVAP